MSHVQPHVRGILQDLETTGVPVIHFGTNTTSLLELQREAGGTVLGCDWRLPLGEAWRRIGHDRAIQGNLDPLLLCAPPEVHAQAGPVWPRPPAGPVTSSTSATASSPRRRWTR